MFQWFWRAMWPSGSGRAATLAPASVGSHVVPDEPPAPDQPLTVQYHLRQVFTKLGIISRSQLDRVLPPDPATAQPR